MELYSTRTIRAGEEVTISYTQGSEYKTASERNAYLRYIYMGLLARVAHAQTHHLRRRVTKGDDC
jgi:hypothetical protein